MKKYLSYSLIQSDKPLQALKQTEKKKKDVVVKAEKHRYSARFDDGKLFYEGDCQSVESTLDDVPISGLFLGSDAKWELGLLEPFPLRCSLVERFLGIGRGGRLRFCPRGAGRSRVSARVRFHRGVSSVLRHGLPLGVLVRLSDVSRG
ncbi:hypothetical protein LSH36_186g02013 [Paralvinella palmiformis]|uniref:Uncharacterized protein n=1 Tax=Paralvinella palmiformis TaxID=53620 RepID=A0AAD9N6W0_9ANNE|nr:hypothetical protein LSH36_186g02013 [Paralvinella palmiformis]